MKKKEAIGLSRLIERGEREMESARRSHREALMALRDACPHADVVEVRLPRPLRDGHKDDSGRIRFCLGCGEKEHGRQFGGRYGLKASYVFDRLKAEPKAALAESALEKLLERLHVMGRFDEFDERGAWHAGEPDYERGTD